jgi:lysophospholipase L1-like esterase
MRILCIADSLALPRPEISYEFTWPALLKKAFPKIDFVNILRRDLTTNVFSEGWEGDSLEFYKPDIVILQIGIVDCAPRYFKKRSLLTKFIRIMPDSFQKRFWSFIKKYKNRNIENSDVPIDRFKNNLENYFNRCITSNVRKVIIIKICTPGLQMVSRNNGITEAVKQYNNIYDDMALKYPILKIVNPLFSGDDELYVDGYHPNKKGNEMVYKCITDILECLN